VNLFPAQIKTKTNKQAGDIAGSKKAHPIVSNTRKVMDF